MCECSRVVFRMVEYLCVIICISQRLHRWQQSTCTERNWSPVLESGHFFYIENKQSKWIKLCIMMMMMMMMMIFYFHLCVSIFEINLIQLACIVCVCLCVCVCVCVTYNKGVVSGFLDVYKSYRIVTKWPLPKQNTHTHTHIYIYIYILVHKI